MYSQDEGNDVGHRQGRVKEEQTLTVSRKSTSVKRKHEMCRDTQES